jgi:hypothetical protein
MQGFELGARLAFNVDGRYVAQMVRNADGASGVVIRHLQTGREQHIAGTGDASSLFWKPDSSTLAIEAICRSAGLTPPIICTPEELPAGRSQ